MPKLKVKTISPRNWDLKRLSSLLVKSRRRKIMVIGDVGIDRYTIGAVERISPEAPVPVVLVQEEKLKLGLAANVADNIQALGATAFLIGVIGKDRSAGDFKDILKERGVSTEHLVIDASRRTALKDRIVSDRQQLLRVDYESLHGVDKVVEKNVLKNFTALVDQVDGIIVEDYAKGVLTENLLQTVFQIAGEQGKWVAVDPNMKTQVCYYRGATVLTPNLKEAEHLAGVKIVDPVSLIFAGEEILKLSNAKYVVITRGKDGMAVFSQGSPIVNLIPTSAREVYDVSGAGDTVIAVLMLALASGGSIEEACVLGNLAAGIEVGKRGTATVSHEEMRSILNSPGI
ncbi:MAG: D-glycero-beta-D-manno-heptose-7-phosphate kinase [Bdellovibrionia bacterium]